LKTELGTPLVPQGLKPKSLLDPDGTTEVVPFPKHQCETF